MPPPQITPPPGYTLDSAPPTPPPGYTLDASQGGGVPSAHTDLPPPPGNLFTRERDQIDQQLSAPPVDSGWRGGIERYGQRAARTFLGPVLHPVAAINSMADNVTMPWKPLMDTAKGGMADLKANGPAAALEDLAGDASGMALQGGVLGGAAAGLPALRSLSEAARGNPDAAALKGLRIGPASDDALSTLKAVQGSRPYLQGANGLEDVQAKIPAAKAEIWSPYQRAVDMVGDQVVDGPEGKTTVRALENRRQELSAQLRTLKGGGPEAIALAQQKGLTQASLLAEERSVQNALDPALQKTGIDPKLIRKTFGQVSEVGSRVEGRSTLAEPPQPYGFGRMLNMRIDNPRSWIGEPAAGVRDLFARRPLWSGSPSDVNLSEAFRTGGEKPNFGSPTMPSPPRPLFQLPSETIGNNDLNGETFEGSYPGQYRAVQPHVTPEPLRPLRLPAATSDVKAPLITPPPLRRLLLP